MEQQQVIIEESALPISAHSLSTSEDTPTTQQEKTGLVARQKGVLDLCRQVQSYVQMRRIWLIIAIPSVIVTNIIAQLNLWRGDPSNQVSTIIGVLSLLLTLPSCLLFYFFSRARRALESLNQAQDLQSVGPLVEALEVNHLRLGAMEALTALLPRLQTNDTHLLKEHHHRLLGQALKRSGRKRFLYMLPGDRKFALAVLHAFEQVGTSEAIPVVEYLTQKATDGEVRRAAAACLPFLQIRAEQAQNEQTLLRASAPHETAIEELLRPAVGQSEVKSEQLLRTGSSAME
jgi:hypothetical protein